MTKLVINPSKKLSKINKEIYGHFSEHLGRCIYGGIYVGEDSPIPNKNGMRTDVVEALKHIKIPVLRWPGGCFADEYHWKDGIGAKETRKKIINTHWGGVIEDNSFGTHEFFELCDQLGCEAYVNGNLGSGTVQEMSEWVEYITFDGISPMAELRRKNGHEKPWKLDFFGIGNENWGCGGNMNPEYYANEYRRYQTYVRNYYPEHPIQKICCGANADDYQWTSEVLKTTFSHCLEELHGNMNGLSLHYYVYPDGLEKKGSSTDFDDKSWYRTLNKALFMKTLIERHGHCMDEFDPEKKVGMIVDEWGSWYTVEPGTNPGFLYQQNTMRDALIAGITLNVFNKHSDRVKMANLAQVVNVLQSVILTDGADMILTPTYHIFDMYKYHQDAMLADSYVETEYVGVEEKWQVPNLTESVSVAEDGAIHITLTNLSLVKDYEVRTVITDFHVNKVKGEIVYGEMHDMNTFEKPDEVVIKEFNKIEKTAEGFTFTIPKCCVLHLEVR